MVPLILGAGRLLAAGAVRGAAAGAARGAVAGGIKESVKKGIVEGAKNKAKSFIKKKVTQTKKVSPGKLIPRSKKDGGGGGLVKKKSTAIIRRPTSDIVKPIKGLENLPAKEQKEKEKEKSFNGDELIEELIAIKKTLIKIKGVLDSDLASKLKNQRNQRILKSKEKASQREAELEKKKPSIGGGKTLEIPKKKLSFFDMIWNYLSNVLMGSLLNFLFNYVPQILKMFEEISKGLENPLQALRLGIITLTKIFPKQIKFLAGLTAKIIGPPAKLIGKLLLKAGGIAGNLFKKAGSIIFNLIKGPLTSLVKKVGGEALEQGVKGAAKGAARLAGKAAGAAGSAIGSTAKILKRFRAFSKVFKRVPIVGMLIGVGIDLAMGESLDRALIGAAGAALGAAIGGAIGTGLIPIPIVGTTVGGFVGSAIGDWAAKKLYANLTGRVEAVDKANPIERRASGGGIGGFFKSLFGGGRSLSRNTSTVQRGSIKTSEVSAQVEKRAKEGVLKDEESLNRFKELSSIFSGTPFVGQLLRMGIDIAMGAKIDKTDTDVAAQDLGYTIGKALENEEFSVPGLNKRIIGPLSKSLTEWAKKRIFYEVKSREGLFPTIQKRGEEPKPPGSAGGGDGGGDGGEPGAGPIVTGGTADFWAMAAVASLENSNPQGQADVAQVLYNRLASGKYAGKSIKALVIAPGQFQPTREGDPKVWAAITDKQSAIAAVATHPRGRTNAARMVEAAAAAIQNPALQKSAAQFVGGRTDFSATGQYAPYPGAIGIIRRHGHDIGWFVGPGSIAYGKTNPGPAKAPRLGNIAVTAPSPPKGGGGNGNEPLASNAQQKGKQIYLHWTAGSYQGVPAGAYHTVITGDGKVNRVIPYDRRGEHTYKRNTNSVGLSLAAMGGSPDPWSVSPTNSQIQGMASEAAKVAKSWGWKSSDVNIKNVMTHAEAASNKDGRAVSDNYGPAAWGGTGERWDLFKLKKGDADGSGGPKMRNLIKQNMGDGIGVNKPHKLPPFAMGGGRVVTSSMGMRNFALSPGMHMGVDIAGRRGEPLQAFTDGVVEASGYEANGYGNWVSWIDNKGIGNFYGHMNKSAFVRPGQRVKKGTILGELGSTGRSSGPHLHWEAATNPKDTGQSKAAVLSRFNPLSRYSKEAPFGGSIKPDPSAATSETGTPMQPSAPGAPGATAPGNNTTGEPALSQADITYSIKGDPAKQSYIDALKQERPSKGGGMGGGSGSGNARSVATSSNSGSRTGKIVEYLTGDPTSPNIAGRAYDRAGHGTQGNYHDHIAFSDRQTAIDAYKFFKSKGVKVTEFKGFDSVGGHATNSYHYSGLAFDVPGYQWGGSGPIGEKDYAGSRKVRKLLNEFFGGNIPVGSGPVPSDIASNKPDRGSSGSTGSNATESSERELTAADISYSIKGDPAKQSYIDYLKSVESPSQSTSSPISSVSPANITPSTTVPSKINSLKQKPSYDQGGQQNIILMPMPQSGQQSQQNTNVSTREPVSLPLGGLNNNEVSTTSMRQIIASAFYKI